MLLPSKFALKYSFTWVFRKKLYASSKRIFDYVFYMVWVSVNVHFCLCRITLKTKLINAGCMWLRKNFLSKEIMYLKFFFKMRCLSFIEALEWNYKFIYLYQTGINLNVSQRIIMFHLTYISKLLLFKWLNVKTLKLSKMMWE